MARSQGWWTDAALGDFHRWWPQEQQQFSLSFGLPASPGTVNMPVSVIQPLCPATESNSCILGKAIQDASIIFL